jgi:hypothetical protein
MKCSLCKSNRIVIEGTGPHKKAICVNCKKFLKFLSKKDVEDIEDSCHTRRGIIKEAMKNDQRVFLKGKIMEVLND